MTERPPDGCGCAAAGAGRDAVAAPAIATRAPDELRAAVAASLVPVPGGFFEMGARASRYPADLDAPPTQSASGPVPDRTDGSYKLSLCPVRGGNRPQEPRGAGGVVLCLSPSAARPRAPLEVPAPHALVAAGAWRDIGPSGRPSDLDGREDHPAIHLNWFDALAFCDFIGSLRPTEAELGIRRAPGLARKQFPWGNALEPGGGPSSHCLARALSRGSAKDGFVGTDAADAFPPNGYGLYNMTGNVWEWCADWFGPPPPKPPPPLPIRNPKGPEAGPGRVIRGGSYLCHASYCERYKVHSRTHNTPDTSTGNLGFRPASDG